ncbi:MAG: DUF4012 domain-containing protein [Actinomycetota bacterium]|nr:DUF4012 domain-containing protein [Actinomycetota bacterium]
MSTTEPDQRTEPDPALESQPPNGPRWVRRGVTAGICILLIVVIALVSLDAVRSARRILSDIKDARAQLDLGAESVVVGDPNASIPQFNAAVASADGAVAASKRPAIRLLGLLPVLGPNVRATRAVATAEGDAARAGLTMAEAAKLLGWDNISIPGAARLGDVDLGKIRAATPKIDGVARQLEAALTALRSAGGGGHLVDTVASGYQDVLVALQRRVVLAEDLRTVFHLLPAMLGGEGERRYLVAIESLGKPRATGGLISAEGVLTAQDGHVELGRLAPASSEMAVSNVSPDLPTDAPAMLRAAQHDGLGALNGVILIDSVGLEDLLWMTGPVSPAVLHNPVTMDSGVDVLERRLYTGTDARAAAAAHAEVSAEILRGFLDRRPSMEAFAIGLAQAISERHLAIWSTSTDDQKGLTQLGAMGAFDTKPGPLAVIWRGTSDNRAVSFVRRTTVQVVRLNPGGLAIVKTKVMMSDHAPKGPPSLLLGEQSPVGSWSADATVYLPRTAVNPSATTTPATSTTIGEDLGVSTATGAMSAAPGHDASMTVTYRQRKAAEQEGSAWRYQLVVLPQPALAPTTVRVSITIPDGSTLVSKANRLISSGGELTYEGAPEAPLTLWVVYS